ncbi:F-box protein [Phanerochaete sordida]|uniref:F-box protein n=1 Tax=Phanerochaete sordida TaxID=48140 RepID=A0A9P3LLC5_9APHY|nr:F-box protein [Phanerochaete sordida]
MSTTGTYAHLAPEEHTRIAAEVEHYLLKAAGLQRRLNASSAVMRLPDELLAEILLLCIPGWCDRLPPVFTGWRPSGWNMPERRGWMRLAHVCHHWREVALHTPRLWNHVEVLRHECVASFVARSRGLPLHLFYDQTRSLSPWIPKEPFDERPRWTPVIQAAHRVHSLFMKLSSPSQTYPSFDIAPGQTFSNLRTLELEHLGDYTQELPPFMSSAMPSLRTFSAYSFHFHVLYPMLRPTLTSLSLRALYLHRASNWVPLLEALRMMTGLEKLAIEQTFFPLPENYRELPLLSHSVVELPCLKSLCITSYVVGGAAAIFLRNICFPGDAMVEIKESRTYAEQARTENEGPFEETYFDCLIPALEWRLSGRATEVIPPPPPVQTLTLELRSEGTGHFTGFSSLLPWHKNLEISSGDSPDEDSQPSEIPTKQSFYIEWHRGLREIDCLVESLSHVPALERVQTVGILLTNYDDNGIRDDDDALRDALPTEVFHAGLAHLRQVETLLLNKQAVYPLLTAMLSAPASGTTPVLFPALKTLHIACYPLSRTPVEALADGSEVVEEGGFDLVKRALVRRTQLGFPVDALVLTRCNILTKDSLQELRTLVREVVWDGEGQDGEDSQLASQ